MLLESSILRGHPGFISSFTLMYLFISLTTKHATKCLSIYINVIIHSGYFYFKLHQCYPLHHVITISVMNCQSCHLFVILDISTFFSWITTTITEPIKSPVTSFAGLRLEYMELSFSKEFFVMNV